MALWLDCIIGLESGKSHKWMETCASKGGNNWKCHWLQYLHR